jgi:hypothetical protein
VQYSILPRVLAGARPKPSVLGVCQCAQCRGLGPSSSRRRLQRLRLLSPRLERLLPPLVSMAQVTVLREAPVAGAPGQVQTRPGSVP